MAGATDGGIDPGRETLLRALRDGDVRFVLIGGAASESHGLPYATQDIDVTPDREHENLERLADVLNRLDCRLEIDPNQPDAAVELPADYFTAPTLRRASVWNLRTVHGKIDLTLAPSGFPDGYTQLAPGARHARVSRTRVEVAIASLHDVEHSKRLANRDKDRDYLEDVGRLDAPQSLSENPSLGRDDGYDYEDELEPPSR
jgi:hypothetical protein